MSKIFEGIAKFFVAIYRGFIKFFKHPIQTTRNFIWEFRIHYQTIKEKIIDFLTKVYTPIKNFVLGVAKFFCNTYKAFTKTKVGNVIHKYCFLYIYKYFIRYIGIILGFFINRKSLKGFLYLSPAIVLLCIFTFYPIINSFIIAFYKNYSPVTNEMDGITLDNFKVIIESNLFAETLLNTGIIVFVSVPISVAISLFIAVMLNSIKKLKAFFQTIFFLPYVTNTIAIGLVFSVMFNYKYGLINSMLKSIGLSAIHWTDASATKFYAMVTLLIYIIWSSLAFKILVFTAGLQNIDKQYYDAARVDGTSKWRIFRRITVPLLSPMIAYVAITSLIGAFKTYTHVVSIFGETGKTDSGKNMRTIVFYVYEYISGSSADPLAPGYLSRGAAASLLLFGIILVFTIVQLYVSKKRVHY